jgi:hypothetical protein
MNNKRIKIHYVHECLIDEVESIDYNLKSWYLMIIYILEGLIRYDWEYDSKRGYNK